MVTSREIFQIIHLIKGQKERHTLPPELLGYASMEDREVYETLRQLDRPQTIELFDKLLEG